jgi:hypothetical protein
MLSTIPPNSSDSSFLLALATFTALVLEGNTPLHLFFGARLIALNKRGSGVRPIAVGCTLRRLVPKVACHLISEIMSQYLSPRQLGFGVKGGIEAAVHAGRYFVNHLTSDEAMVKLDFHNAFNSLRSDCMLLSVFTLCPSIFPFVFSVYSTSSSLYWEQSVVNSAEGVQQGDPLGPLLFCLTLHQYLDSLSSPLCIGYLDDITLGGPVESVVSDISVIKEAEKIGLCLNPRKSEIISVDDTSITVLSSTLPGAPVVHPKAASLLGSPSDCITAVINEKISSLQLMGKRLAALNMHDAVLLLRYSFSIPRLIFFAQNISCISLTLSVSVRYTSLFLLSSLLNISINITDNSWSQASLSIWSGGLGFRSVVQLAPSCFLASAAAFYSLITHILPYLSSSISIPHREEALSMWYQNFPTSPPSPPARCDLQRA